MRIIIETTGEQIAIRPEEQQMVGTGAGAAAAMDAGPPRAELLQALGERGAGATARAASQEEAAATATPAGKPTAWH